MGLECEYTVGAVLCTASDALAARLRAMLLRWANVECVRLTVETVKSLPEKERTGADLLFLDMDSV